MSENGSKRFATIRIQRFNPDTDKKPYLQTYQVEITQGMTILDALHQIKTSQDGSVTYRRSCRHAICGSCAMNVNGSNRLVCESTLKDYLDGKGTITIRPLPFLPILKDLVDPAGEHPRQGIQDESGRARGAERRGALYHVRGVLLILPDGGAHQEIYGASCAAQSVFAGARST